MGATCDSRHRWAPHCRRGSRSTPTTGLGHRTAIICLTLEVSCKAAQAELGAPTEGWGRLVSFSDSLYRRGPAGRKGPTDRSADAERTVGPRSSRGRARAGVRAAGSEASGATRRTGQCGDRSRIATHHEGQSAPGAQTPSRPPSCTGQACLRTARATHHEQRRG